MEENGISLINVTLGLLSFIRGSFNLNTVITATLRHFNLLLYSAQMCCWVYIPIQCVLLLAHDEAGCCIFPMSCYGVTGVFHLIGNGTCFRIECKHNIPNVTDIRSLESTAFPAAKEHDRDNLFFGPSVISSASQDLLLSLPFRFFYI